MWNLHKQRQIEGKVQVKLSKEINVNHTAKFHVIKQVNIDNSSNILSQVHTRIESRQLRW